MQLTQMKWKAKYSCLLGDDGKATSDEDTISTNKLTEAFISAHMPGSLTAVPNILIHNISTRQTFRIFRLVFVAHQELFPFNTISTVSGFKFRDTFYFNSAFLFT